jgi:hypothetical protein
MPNYTYRVPAHGEVILVINAPTLAEADATLLATGKDYVVQQDVQFNPKEAELISRDNIGE